VDIIAGAGAARLDHYIAMRRVTRILFSLRGARRDINGRALPSYYHHNEHNRN
jgi:hypothetical protein